MINFTVLQLDLLHRRLETTPEIDTLRFHAPNQTQPRRNDFAVLADVRRIEKAVQAELVRLDKDDGLSVFKWVNKLRATDTLLGFKSRTCPAPPGSDLRPDTFTLMVQTPWQREQYTEHGSKILFVDGTHNTTMYENMTLTSLLVRNNWGHGRCLHLMIFTHRLLTKCD